MEHKETYIYGRHAVLEALAMRPEAVSAVYLTPESPDAHLRNVIVGAGVTEKELNPRKLPGKLPQNAAHQGVVAAVRVDALMQPYHEFVDALEVTPETSLVILGEVQDPHNVGAIIRSAAAFGVSGVLIPPHNQSPVTGTVVKVSAGMAFQIPLVAIRNVNATARDLKERGFWIYGLDGTASQTLTAEPFERPSVFIFGNEGSGLRAMTRSVCDILLRIPMHKRAESLNVAAAAAVTLYGWSSAHPAVIGETPHARLEQSVVSDEPKSTE